MKIKQYIGWAVCTCLLASCQNDEALVEQPSEAVQTTLIGQINQAEEGSRAQIQLGCMEATVEYFFWNEGDRFHLYQKQGESLKKSEFVISDDYDESDGGSSHHEFVSSDKLVPLADYVAVYPHTVAETDGQFVFDLPTVMDFSAATTKAQQDDVWKAYFNDHMYMVASGTLSASGRNYINFQHQCALARITYTNQTGSPQTLTGMCFGGDQYFGTKMSYDLAEKTTQVLSKTDRYEIKFKGLTVADKETVDLYAFFFPLEFGQGKIAVSLLQENATKTLNLPLTDVLAVSGSNKSFLAGMRYRFSVTDTSNGLVWTKDLDVDNIVTIQNKSAAKVLYQMLGDYKVTMTTEGYARIHKDHVFSLYTLDFSNCDTPLESLDGFEIFTNVNTLKCNGVGLKEVDLSVFQNMFTVELNNNDLTALDLSKNPRINQLSCYGNKLKELDVSSLNLWGNEDLVCGDQQDDQFLKLTMTEDQKNKWEQQWSHLPHNTNVTYDGMSDEAQLRFMAKTGGSFTLKERIWLTAPLIVEGDLTIDLNGDVFSGPMFTENYKDTENWKTYIVVKPGATLTVNDSKGGGQLNTGQGLEFLSCIRMAGGSNEPSKVVLNGGWVVGTYYAVVIDRDCTHGELEIRNGRIEGDFNKNYNGLAVLNAGDAKVTVKGGSLVGHGSAIEMQGGSLYIEGGEFVCEQKHFQQGASVNPNVGNTLLGPAVCVAPRADLDDEMVVSISKGLLRSNGYSSFHYVKGSSQKNAKISITDGTFYGGIFCEGVTEFISGGQYKVEPVASYVVPNLSTFWDGNYYIIREKISEGDSEGENFGNGGEY